MTRRHVRQLLVLQSPVANRFVVAETSPADADSGETRQRLSDFAAESDAGRRTSVAFARPRGYGMLSFDAVRVPCCVRTTELTFLAPRRRIYGRKTNKLKLELFSMLSFCFIASVELRFADALLLVQQRKRKRRSEYCLIVVHWTRPLNSDADVLYAAPKLAIFKILDRIFLNFS